MQTVNLYLPEYRPKREWLSLENSLIGFALFLMAMSALHLSQSQNLESLNQKVALLQQQEADVKQQAEQLKNKASTSDRKRLQLQVDELRAAIGNRNALKKILSGSSLGNQSGFSEHMYTLGEKRTQDLVLNRFVLTRGGEFVELEGLTRTPSSVPLYVHELQAAPVFLNAKFGFLTIDDVAGLARFRLSGGGLRSADIGQSRGNNELRQ